MFDKEKWQKINLSQYRDLKIKEKENDNSIIEGISFENLLIKKGILSKIPFAIKDNFSIAEETTTSASKIIRNFIPNYNSTIFLKLINEGAVPLFKSNLDELAMGGTGLTSNYGPVYNPFNKKYILGGSSSGSNYLVADGTVSFSIGSDTGDSVRKPASFTGIVGFKPTWGLVSRNGLYDFAPTWDTVAWFTKNIKESAILLDILQGFDPLDQSSMHPKDKNYFENIEMNNEKYKIITIPSLEKDILDEEILQDYKKAIEILRKDGHEIIEILDDDYKLLSSILVIYKVISSTEAFSCNSNLTGFHFGANFGKEGDYEDKVIHARTKGFGYEVKKRFLFSQEAKYNDKNYYLKAVKLRRKVNEEINRILSKGDVLLIPSTPNLANNINNLNKIKFNNLLNSFLILFNSNGSPSLTMPITKNGHLSTAINFSSLPFNDKKIFKIANRLEELIK
ncbi:MAG: aspartyl/glutamyl-tRNA amidotransferase subunit A [Candidatus Tyloplasma litorale]|nr:MAG: aspartyl/glutamyl-tRNA amidotransferase subunit A [Mycoplasmatales bacterium]